MYFMNIDNMGGKMNNLDVYLKSRHDFVNQFQLLYTYKQLGKDDEVNSLLDELYNNLKQEQLFLNAPCRKFVQEVFKHKISTSGSKWTFEIECSYDEYYQKNLELSDSVMLDIYQTLKSFIKEQCDDIQLGLRLTVEKEFVILNIFLNEMNLNDEQLKIMFSEYNVEILSEDDNDKEIEFFININELEV